MVEVKACVLSLVDRGFALYNSLMEKCLGINLMRTYYSSPDAFIAEMNGRYWHCGQDDVLRMQSASPLLVVGRDAVERVIRSRVRTHAFQSAFVTFVCSLPCNCLLWPLMIVDVVYFQRKVFVCSQEVYMLYANRKDYAFITFNYAWVLKLVTRLLDPFMIRQTKNALGVAGRVALQKGSEFLSPLLRLGVRQFFKWSGVVAAREVIDSGYEQLVLVACALIASAITYWLFIPMVTRIGNVTQLENIDSLD